MRIRIRALRRPTAPTVFYQNKSWTLTIALWGTFIESVGDLSGRWCHGASRRRVNVCRFLPARKVHAITKHGGCVVLEITGAPKQPERRFVIDRNTGTSALRSFALKELP